MYLVTKEELHPVDLEVKSKCKLKAIFCLPSHWCHCDLVVSGYSRPACLNSNR